MRVLLEVGYYRLLLKKGADIGSFVNAIDGAVVVDKSYGDECYKETKAGYSVEIVKDCEVTPLPEKDKIYLDDIKKANERAATYLKEKEDLEKELKDMKEKFSPFLETKEEESKENA